MFSATAVIASGVAYFVRGQKKPFSPSPLVRGTTCTWRCGTLWLTTLFIATNVPSAPSATGTARASACTDAKNGATDSAASSGNVTTCMRGTTRT
jgi:hypothetical protein